MPAPSNSAQREWRFRLLLLAISCLLSFAFAEIGLRVLGVAAPPSGNKGSLTFFSHHPQLGWDLVPGARDHHEAPEFETEIEITSQGLRSHQEFDTPPPPGQRRLLVLGDSFTFGHGVDVEEAWPALLDVARDDFEVVNLAVTGYGTDQQVLRFEQRAEEFKPDAVMLGLFVGNVFRNARFEQLGYAKPRFLLRRDALELTGVPVPSERPNPDRHSRLLRLVTNGTRTVAEHLGLGEAWPVTGAILDRLKSHCDELDVPLFVVVLPKDQLIYGSGPRLALHEKTLAKVLDLLVQHGLSYLDLTSALREQAQQQETDRLYFARDGHWTKTGHQVAAVAIEGWLKQALPQTQESTTTP